VAAVAVPSLYNLQDEDLLSFPNATIELSALRQGTPHWLELRDGTDYRLVARKTCCNISFRSSEACVFVAVKWNLVVSNNFVTDSVFVDMLVGISNDAVAAIST